MKIYHWWPGRTWRGPCPIPYFVKLAQVRGSRYMTVIISEEATGIAFCCPRDVPSRKMGRAIALGRWAKNRLEAEAPSFLNDLLDKRP